MSHGEDDTVWFVIMLIFGIACAMIASSKGRTPIGWFFIGFIITWIGLILVLVLPNERERERVHHQARADRRRLREQLRQERMKNEAYRRHAAARLDAHDHALGMDTRQTTALPAGHGMQTHALPGGSERAQEIGSESHAVDGGARAPRTPPPPVQAAKEWFYEVAGESRGPVTAAAIRNGLARGRIEATTLVWREGMADWQAVSQVPQFRASFHG